MKGGIRVFKRVFVVRPLEAKYGGLKCITGFLRGVPVIKNTAPFLCTVFTWRQVWHKKHC